MEEHSTPEVHTSRKDAFRRTLRIIFFVLEASLKLRGLCTHFFIFLGQLRGEEVTSANCCFSLFRPPSPLVCFFFQHPLFFITLLKNERFDPMGASSYTSVMLAALCLIRLVQHSRIPSVMLESSVCQNWTKMVLESWFHPIELGPTVHSNVEEIRKMFFVGTLAYLN